MEYGKNSQEPPTTSRIPDLIGISNNTIPPFIPNLHNIFKAQSITTTTTTTSPMTSTSSKLVTTNALLTSRVSIFNKNVLNNAILQFILLSIISAAFNCKHYKH